MREQRQQAAFPSYLREIVDGIYVAHDIPAQQQQEIEHAMSSLLEQGKRLCIDFGVLNAIALADPAGLRTTPEAEAP